MPSYVHPSPPVLGICHDLGLIDRSDLRIDARDPRHEVVKRKVVDDGLLG